MKSVISGSLRKIKKKVITTFSGNCAVLFYHRVTTLQTDPQLLSVTPENFDSQLSHLKKHHTVLSIEELKFHIENKKKFPARSVALTFDDGYADNYSEALPLLEKHNFNAIFYIATGTLNTGKEFWWDALERIILLNDTSPLENQFKLSDTDFELQNLNMQKRVQLYEQLLPLMRQLVSDYREQKINELASIFQSKIPRPGYRAMTFVELRKMSESKSAVIGAHTHLHPALASLSYGEQWSEIKTSKEILERELNQKVIHFSFPFGTRKDFNDDTLAICRQLNFEMVAANYPYITHSNTNIMQFPRFLVRNWNVEEFKLQLNSFFA